MNPVRAKFLGILWILLACLLAIFADAIYKNIQKTAPMNVVQVLCLKHFFSFLTTIAFLLITKRSLEYKPEYKLESIRGVLIFLSSLAWYYGLYEASLSSSSLIALLQPVFIMIFAGIILKEEIVISKLLVMGMMLICIFSINWYIGRSFFAGGIIFITIAVILFSVLDVLTKSLSINNKGAVTNTFYSNMFTVVFSFSGALFIEFVNPTLYQISLLALLGVVHTFMTLAFILAFEKAELNILAPYKYSEIIFAIIIDYTVFANIPDKLTKYQALCILPCSLITLIIDRIRMNKLSNLTNK
jgi:drug/metabolite transporter (DMT)-like permease